MYQLLLRSFHCLELLQHRSPLFRAHAWTSREWIQIAEFEAVLRPVCKLAMEVLLGLLFCTAELLTVYGLYFCHFRSNVTASVTQ